MLIEPFGHEMLSSGVRNVRAFEPPRKSEIADIWIKQDLEACKTRCEI
jgi:hypothetical protein